MIVRISKYKNWLLMSVSILFGVIAAFSISKHLDHKTREIESKSRGAQIVRVVASRDLLRSSVIKIEDLATHSFPVGWITADAISVEQVDSLIGKQITVDLKAGQLVHWAITSEKSSVPLSARLPRGKRAITIPVDLNNSLSGLLSPTDRIDLYVSFDHQGKKVTSLLLSGIEVLATGRDLVSHEHADALRQDHFSTLALATSPDDAVKLVSARQTGIITAVLSQETDSLQGARSQTSPRGHLAGLLGMDSTHAPVIPILYGDRISAEDLQSLSLGLTSDSSIDSFGTP